MYSSKDRLACQPTRLDFLVSPRRHANASKRRAVYGMQFFLSDPRRPNYLDSKKIHDPNSPSHYPWNYAEHVGLTVGVGQMVVVTVTRFVTTLESAGDEVEGDSPFDPALEPPFDPPVDPPLEPPLEPPVEPPFDPQTSAPVAPSELTDPSGSTPPCLPSVAFVTGIKSEYSGSSLKLPGCVLVELKTPTEKPGTLAGSISLAPAPEILQFSCCFRYGPTVA